MAEASNRTSCLIGCRTLLHRLLQRTAEHTEEHPLGDHPSASSVSTAFLNERGAAASIHVPTSPGNGKQEAAAQKSFVRQDSIEEEIVRRESELALLLEAIGGGQPDPAPLTKPSVVRQLQFAQKCVTIEEDGRSGYRSTFETKRSRKKIARTREWKLESAMTSKAALLNQDVRVQRVEHWQRLRLQDLDLTSDDDVLVEAIENGMMNALEK